MNIHSLKSLLQGHFTDGLVTIVGSGLSCAEGLPGMGGLANYLREDLSEKLCPEDNECWVEICKIIDLHGLEAALLQRRPTEGLESAIVASTASFIANEERQVIADVFLRRKSLRFSRLLKHVMCPSTGIPIITTNYDRLVEVAAEEAGLGVDTLFVGHFAGQLNDVESGLSFIKRISIKNRVPNYHTRNRVNVFKPHGSLDWYYREGKPVRYAGDLAVPRLIITPGLNKFRSGYESPFDKHREKANNAIEKARVFLIIGYGFNDDHLETHLTPRIKSGVPTLILTYSLSSNALKLAEDNPRVVAIQFDRSGEVDGSLVVVEKQKIFYPNINLWDVGSFTAEVLEP